MDKKIEISMLWQIYGALLTEKQKEYIDYYYNEDLSLAEIAQNDGITRQGVRDIIKKGEKKLFEYEEKLLFMKKTMNQEKQIENILAQLNKMQKDGEIRWQNVYFVIFFVIFAVFLQVLRLSLQSYENPMNFTLKYKIFIIICYTYVRFCI